MGRDLDAVTHAAERVLSEFDQATLPVDPRAIATERLVSVVAKPTDAGVSGMLIRVCSEVTIAYATHLQNEGFENFSIAHELGHYFLPGHIDHVIGQDGIHKSRADHESRDPHEVEADRFAAALLMPYHLFVSAARLVPDGLVGIEQLAKLRKTSLSATAIRYAECMSDELFAVVVSRSEQIEFCSMSQHFSKQRDLTWRKKGDEVPRKTATYGLLGDPGRILHADRESGTPHFHEWFDTGPNLRLVEEAVGLGQSGRVLTILTVGDALDEDEVEEETDVVESWTPRFRR